MTTLDPRALKPCPFCGSRNVAQGASGDRISVWCDCGARGPDVPFPLDCIDPVTPIKECHEFWNRRALTAIDVGSTLPEALIERMVQQFLRWKLPEDFNPDGGISFTKISNAGTSYEYRHEPVGTNLFDYSQAKAMVQHMLEGLPAIGAGGQAVARPLHWIDVLREWFGGERYARDYEYLDANYSDHARRVATYAATLSQPHPADERVVEALREAADRFDEIRVILIEHLDEPERNAFWKAVNGREFCRHALATEGRKNG